MTGDEAMSLVQAKKDRRLNTEACMRFARTLANGGGSLADLDDALWLTETIDAAVAEALAARWVPVAERTPPRRQSDGLGSAEVLAQAEDGSIVVAFTFVLDGALVWSSGHERHRVVAWQPLPAAWVAP